MLLIHTRKNYHMHYYECFLKSTSHFEISKMPIHFKTTYIKSFIGQKFRKNFLKKKMHSGINCLKNMYDRFIYLLIFTCAFIHYLFILLFVQKWTLRYFVRLGQKFIKLKGFCFWRWLSLKKKENVDKMLFHLEGTKSVHPNQYISLSGKWQGLNGHKPSVSILTLL